MQPGSRKQDWATDSRSDRDGPNGDSPFVAVGLALYREPADWMTLPLAL